jgi:hypothetical protein
VGCRWFEFYNNTYRVPDSSDGGSGTHNQYSMMDLRAGSGVVFNERTTGGSNAGLGYCQFREEDTTGYPALWQIGRGKNTTNPPNTGSDQALDPVYCWNNVFKNGPVSLSPTYIQDGRDFYSNTMKPGYTPYTYPHPLTGGSGPPTNAKVQITTP